MLISPSFTVVLVRTNLEALAKRLIKLLMAVVFVLCDLSKCLIVARIMFCYAIQQEEDPQNQ